MTKAGEEPAREVAVPYRLLWVGSLTSILLYLSFPDLIPGSAYLEESEVGFFHEGADERINLLSV